MALLLTVTSCRWVSEIVGGDEVVAKVGHDKLYRSDLVKLIPPGISSDDSTKLALQYINSWASDRVFTQIAEEKLSKEEKDVTAELEDYRKSLLKYRYEQHFINERLDTSISFPEMEKYYADHSDKFILSVPVAKVTFLCISSDSPLTERIRNRMSSEEAEELEEADSLAYSAALKYTDFDGKWVDMTALAKEFGTDFANLQDSRSGNWIERSGEDGTLRLSYIKEYMRSGEVAPFDYAVPFIRDYIISARKQALVGTLEQDLLKEARENNDFVIY